MGEVTGPTVTFLSLAWPREGQHSGGVGRYVARLANALSQHCTIRLIAFSDADLSLAPQVTLVPIPVPRSQFDRYYRSPVRAARVLRRLDPEVIHSHGDDWALAFLKQRRRVIRTFYGSSLGEALGGGRALRRLNHLLLFLTELISRAAIRYRVAIGPDSARTFASQMLIPPVVPDPVGSAKPLAERSPAVVYIGPYHGRKRGWLAEQTWKKVIDTRPDVELHVIGPEDDRIHFDARVRYSAGLPDACVQQLIASSIALIAPSSYEGFGIPVWEAMRRGTPVVATPNPGFLWQQAVGGGIVLTDEKKLAQALAGLLTSPEAWVRASRAAVAAGERISEIADPRKYLDLYNAVIDHGR